MFLIRKVLSLCVAGLIISALLGMSYGSEMSTYIVNGKIVQEMNLQSDEDLHEIRSLDNKYNRYFDYSKGYSMKMWNDMNLDVSIAAVRSKIFNNDKVIEIYYDDFSGTIHSSDIYVSYSNKFLQNTKDHIKEYETNIKIDGMNAHILQWRRSKLEKVKNDKPYYASAEIVKNKQQVYTIIIKSASPFINRDEYMDIFKSFDLIEKKGISRINAVYGGVSKKLSDETLKLYNSYFAEESPLKWGIFEPGAPDNLDKLNMLEERMDFNFEFIIRYHHIPLGGFPITAMEKAYNNRKHVLFTLQTMYPGEDNSSITYDILSGKYESYFQDMAKDIKEFGHPILFRLNNEMNGEWCPFTGFLSSKDSDLYVEVWRYIYGIFKENEVDNVLWVWNPHDLSFPGFNINHYLTYYPGDEFVDIVGLTGYNTGTYYKGEKWRGFREIYTPLYEEYSTIFKQPLMITEFGSNSVGGNKMQWINEMFDYIRDYERIKVAIWWSGTDWDTKGNAARIYRLDQSQEMLDLFKIKLREYK